MQQPRKRVRRPMVRRRKAQADLEDQLAPIIHPDGAPTRTRSDIHAEGVSKSRGDAMSVSRYTWRPRIADARSGDAGLTRPHQQCG